MGTRTKLRRMSLPGWIAILFLLLVVLGQVVHTEDEGEQEQASCNLPPNAQVIDLEALRREQYGDLSTEEFIHQRTQEAACDEDGHPIFEESVEDTIEEEEPEIPEDWVEEYEDLHESLEDEEEEDEL